MTDETRTDDLNDQPHQEPLQQEQNEEISSRRELFAEAGKWAAGLAAVAAPAAAVGLFSRSAFAGHPASVEDVLGFALTLEYLEADFYAMGVDSGVLEGADADDRAMAIFTEIRNHEQAHVGLLEGALGLSEGQNKPDFDFTAGGNFDPFNDYATFLLLAQAFEDTGVRAYKGQAHALLGQDVLTTALRIHSVEARHASIVRRLRGLQGWIPLDQPGAPAPVQPVYAGEDQATQLGVDLDAMLEFDTEQITESFDEPLTMDAVLEIASPFIVSTN
jgi:rubrerythrin